MDDDPAKVGRRIHGVPVLGTRHGLKDIIAKHRPDEVLIAIPNADPATVRAVIRALEPFKLPIKTLPNLRDVIGGKVDVKEIRSLAVEDLLARPPVGLDPAPLKHLIRGRRVMVTGAGGSIGSELCRQIVEARAGVAGDVRALREQPPRGPPRARGQEAGLRPSRRRRRRRRHRVRQRGDAEAPAGDRLPRRRAQARAADGREPVRGDQEQRARHPPAGPGGGAATASIASS